MIKITIIRHGQASVLSDNYDQLSDLGKEQVRLLGEHFVKSNLHFDKLIQGPLFRHQQSTEGIISAYQDQNLAIPPIETMEAFREHQGPRVVRAITPIVAQSDEQLKQILAKATPTRKEKIWQHLKIYEYLTRLWVEGKVPPEAAQYQSWQAFLDKVNTGIQNVYQNAEQGQHIAIVSSGGPVAASIGDVLGLTPMQTLELSWMVENASFSEIHISSKRRSLRHYNCTGHLTEARLVTTI